ncbi:hypothetical protein N431DRAFT_451287 [Stipitochalara longipes BDJ]|nr:hypothetical protein N431DRAFT_451287 [Stipitochalara longipes BDJ]
MTQIAKRFRTERESWNGQGPDVAKWQAGTSTQYLVNCARSVSSLRKFSRETPQKLGIKTRAVQIAQGATYSKGHDVTTDSVLIELGVIFELQLNDCEIWVVQKEILVISNTTNDAQLGLARLCCLPHFKEIQSGSESLIYKKGQAVKRVESFGLIRYFELMVVL